MLLELLHSARGEEWRGVEGEARVKALYIIQALPPQSSTTVSVSAAALGVPCFTTIADVATARTVTTAPQRTRLSGKTNALQEITDPGLHKLLSTAASQV